MAREVDSGHSSLHELPDILVGVPVRFSLGIPVVLGPEEEGLLVSELSEGSEGKDVGSTLVLKTRQVMRRAKRGLGLCDKQPFSSLFSSLLSLHSIVAHSHLPLLI